MIRPFQSLVDADLKAAQAAVDAWAATIEIERERAAQDPYWCRFCRCSDCRCEELADIEAEERGEVIETNYDVAREAWRDSGGE